MALNNCGPISIGGCTTGQSIAKELGLTTTATHSLNCSSYRTLAGVSSGTISMSNFYGKSNASYMNISTSGASVYTSGNYKTAVFSGSGSFSVTVGSGVGNYGNHISYIIVAGGGAGGSLNGQGGGGGAGGVIQCTTCLGSGGFAVSNGTYSVTVGGGGAVINTPGSFNQGNYRGGCSNFGGLSATGGGYGGWGIINGCTYYNHYNGSSGGSGGGGSAYGLGGFGSVGYGGSGISGQGLSGGSGFVQGSYQCCPCSGPYFAPTSWETGGGGGKSTSACGSFGTQSNGGSGLTVSGIFTGMPATVAGGGGGLLYGYPSFYVSTSTNGLGGSGGGGTGSAVYNYGSTFSRHASSPTANTGSGGGGGAGTNDSTAGASGIVAIRWRFQ